MSIAALLVVHLALLAGTDPGQQAARPAAPQQAQQQQPSPIKIVPPVVDLGAVLPGSTNPGKFTLVNTGKDPVVVRDAVPNCKCTAISDVKGKTIAPGGTLELTAALTAGQTPGEKEATVFLTFDPVAPAREPIPPAAAKIKGDVRLAVNATPPYIDALKGVSKGTVKLRSADGKPFGVLRSGGRDPVYIGFDPAKDAPRAEYELAWDFAGTAPTGMPLWWFVFTDRPECPVIPLRVRHENTGTKHDMARFQRFWIIKEALVLGGNFMVGKPGELELVLEHYNPPKRGAIERPDWNDVRSVRSLTPDATVRFLSRRETGADESVVKIEVVPTKVGMIEGELEVTTATGVGRVPFAMFARTW